ncbi:MAG: nuclear transport factor 2 family protein [Bacteroidota bacterium]|nr:nuclear transport factor 2 family protein [Bacteroidota bacterium]
MSDFTLREQLIEIVNKLFVYTDNRQWQKLQDEVFADKVLFDMSSLGAGAAEEKLAKDICAMWETGFQGIDAIHHQSGNFLVTVSENTATVFCYAIASHYKAAAAQGKTREFVGNYDIGLTQTDKGWRIKAFKYTVKYTSGNLSLE